MMISDVLKAILIAKKESDETVNVLTKLYDLSGENELLISSPSIITKHRETAEIYFGDYVLSLTPN